MDASTTYDLEVPEIGTFTFLKRTPRLSMRAVGTAVDFIGGVARTAWQSEVGSAYGELSVLTVKGPEGWDLEKLDPLEPADYAKLMTVVGALREQEARFRRGAAA